MKKLITPEVKIALLAIVGIALLYFGMNFLKGLNIFSTVVNYRIYFDDISGLTKTCPIYANGYKVGIVRDIVYDFTDNQKDIIANVSIDEDMQIPEGTKAEIISNLMGDVHINLILGKSRERLEPNGLIPGRINGGSMEVVKGMVPSIQKMLPTLDSILINVNQILGDPALRGSLHNAEKISADLTTSTKQLNILMAQMNATLPGLTNKTNQLLTSANETMQNANGGIKEARNSLSGANALVNNLNEKVSAIDVQATMQQLNSALNDVNTLTQTLNSNKGTLGLLLNDPGLYNNLNNTVRSMDSLMVNIKAHPKRYVHFSIFGRKDK